MFWCCSNTRALILRRNLTPAIVLFRLLPRSFLLYGNLCPSLPSQSLALPRFLHFLSKRPAFRSSCKKEVKTTAPKNLSRSAGFLSLAGLSLVEQRRRRDLSSSRSMHLSFSYFTSLSVDTAGVLYLCFCVSPRCSSTPKRNTSEIANRFLLFLLPANAEASLTCMAPLSPSTRHSDRPRLRRN